MSAGMIVFVGAIVAGATGAFFSDSEVSTGNVMAAGAIDLGIDNSSYYNGVLSTSTSWGLDFDIDPVFGDNPATVATETDFLLESGKLFFNFNDLKPGDYGEDTISLHVTNNESWLCADVTLTENDDETCNEPENDIDAENGACVEPDADIGDGDLAQNINFLWWADDGDNVLETDETALPAGALGSLGVGNTATVALADSNENIFGVAGDPILTDDPAEILYVGKAWCFGAIAPAPTAIDDTVGNNPSQDNNAVGGAGTPEDGGYTCAGAAIGNAAQTDKAMLNVGFRAVQARHNANFQCQGVPVIPDPLIS